MVASIFIFEDQVTPGFDTNAPVEAIVWCDNTCDCGAIVEVRSLGGCVRSVPVVDEPKNGRIIRVTLRVVEM